MPQIITPKNSAQSKIDVHERWFANSPSLNPIRGCTKLSEGCANCYVEREASKLKKKFAHLKNNPYENEFKLTLWPGVLTKKPPGGQNDNIFLCDMSDLFHEDVPDDFIKEIFGYIVNYDKWHFSICTKRADRMANMAPSLPWPPNLWAGVTIELNKYVYRADRLRTIQPALRYIFAEPLIGPLPDLDLTGIGGLMCGGESADIKNHNKLRITKKEWVIELRNKCKNAGVPFFFKQWGDSPKNPDRSSPKKWGGCLLEGKVYHERPPLYPKLTATPTLISERLPFEDD